MFPMELCQRLMEIYTKKGDVVLDPFMGSGSAIIVARDMERKGIGADISKMVKLIRLVGVLLQSKVYLFWQLDKTS